ncbi:MAG TPA: hypothetical protein VFB13_19595 [Reyranella sp.]|jgi:hypothetical protein|nr:hypothetical protein [Reyranella sp.]
MAIDTEEETPPVDPGDELPLEHPEAFAAECLQAVGAVKAVQPMAIGKAITTRHPKWGEIWRADFDIDPDSIRPLVNRIVCWRQNGDVTVMFAIGQSVPPL